MRVLDIYAKLFELELFDETELLEIEMFFIIKLYLHLNCVIMLNWIVWNGTVFDIETLLTQNWIVYIEVFWHLTVCKKNLFLY